MTKEKFGAWVKSIRVECEYTQEKLAHLLGFNSSQSIANIESGRTLLPKHCYKKFVQTFRLDPEKFIDMVMEVKKAEVYYIVFGKKYRPGK